MVGISNVTSVTLEALTNLTNHTSYADLAVDVNYTVYGGVLYFVLLWVAWVILFFAGQRFSDQPLNNIVFGGVVVPILSFLLRAIEIVKFGVVVGMLTDFQMWVFPLITIVLVMILWATKSD